MSGMPKTGKEARMLGLTRYFTGKPCPSGHVSYRLASNSKCIACNKEQIKKMSQTEEWKNRRKETWKANSDKNKNRSKEYRESDRGKETRRKCWADWYAKNATKAGGNRLKGRKPKWNDDVVMGSVYVLSRKLGLVVDHILPINGKNVCGLHVHTNVQLLTVERNSMKSNDFDAAKYPEQEPLSNNRKAFKTQVLNAVLEERDFQDQKWGPIDENPHDMGTWLLLIESELNEAKLAAVKGGDGRNAVRHELIQVAALCMATLENHGLTSYHEGRDI